MKLFCLILIMLLLSLEGFSQDEWRKYHLNYSRAVLMDKKGEPDSVTYFLKKCFETNLFFSSKHSNFALKKLKHANEDSLTRQIKIRASGQKVDFVYAQKIDSIFKIDQKNRSKKFQRAMRFIAENDNDSIILSVNNQKRLIKSRAIQEAFNIQDSLNISCLLDLIDKRGFPSPRIVGDLSSNNAFIILLHFDKDSLNRVLSPIIDSALLNGELSPNDYAWICDRRSPWGRNGLPIYYKMPYGVNSLGEKDLIIINERRKSIGLLGVFEGRIIKFRGNTMLIRELNL